MRRLLPALLMLVAACSGASPPTVTALPPVLTSAPEPAPGAPTLPATTAPPAGRCFPDGPVPDEFVEAGVVGTAGGPGGDARLIAEVRLDSPRAAAGDEDGCERLAVEMATTDGAPATAVGIVEVELLTRPGVLRLRFSSLVADTAVADVLLEGGLVRRAFVVRDPDGLTIDAHLEAAVAAAVVPGSRGRVLVDLRRVGDLPVGTAVAGSSGAVLEPAGAVASYPLLVAGYGRSDDGELEITVSGADGEVTETVAVPAFPWGRFEAVIVDGPTGTVEVTAGDAVQTVLVG